MKRLNDEELEYIYEQGSLSANFHQHLILIELNLRILDKLNEKPEERKIVLG